MGQATFAGGAVTAREAGQRPLPLADEDGFSRAESESLVAAITALATRRRKRRQGKGAGAERGGAAPAPPLPCLFETTASDDDRPPLPGPRKKQAQALTENIKWMAEAFGRECIGFLTLTLGDLDAGGRFRNLRDRKEAQRRFHSLLTNEISRRYLCGVTVTERHANGGIHFHLVVACRKDIRGGLDFAACFPPKDAKGKPQYRPDYSSASDALRREWAYWRRVAKLYGFGRHQLQPMRENGEALGRYLGAYLRKDWDHRLPEDKGARCVRYFGHWSKRVRRKGEREGPPHCARFGWLTPRARAWREMVSQVVIVLNWKGARISERNIKDIVGARWAWKVGRLFESVRFETAHVKDEAVRRVIEEANFKVQVRWLSGGGDPARNCWWHITEITLDHLRASPEWKREMEELERAKEPEAAERKGLKVLAERRAQEEEKYRLLREVAAEFDGLGVPGQP